MKISFFSVVACAPFALFMTACSDAERFPVSIDVSSAVSTPGAAPLAINAGIAGPSTSLSFGFPGEVHEIEVLKCDRGCEAMDDWGTFEQATVVWDTGVGEHEWSADEATEPRLDPPTIAGSVQYGVKPSGAGYETDVTPLSDGHYSVHMSVYGQCDQGYGHGQCLHTDRHGAAYFDVVNGSVIKR